MGNSKLQFYHYLQTTNFVTKWSFWKTCFQLSNFAIALVSIATLRDWLKKFRAIFLNKSENQNQSWLARMRFPALGAGDMYLLRALFGSLDCLPLFWLAKMITFGFGFRTLNSFLGRFISVIRQFICKSLLQLWGWSFKTQEIEILRLSAITVSRKQRKNARKAYVLFLSWNS